MVDMVDMVGVASCSAVAKNREKNAALEACSRRARTLNSLSPPRRVAPERVARIQKAMVCLADYIAGTRVMQIIGTPGYNVEDSTRPLDLLAWLEKP